MLNTGLAVKDIMEARSGGPRPPQGFPSMRKAHLEHVMSGSLHGNAQC